MTVINIDSFRTLKAAHSALDARLKETLAEFGLTYEPGRVVFDETRKTVKFAFTGIIGTKEDVVERDKREYEQFATLLGLPADGFGKVFRDGNSRYKIVGVQPNKPKNCVRLQRLGDGKKFQCAASFVNSNIGRTA